MDYFHLSAPKQDLLNMSSLGFAYLGDAVYEVMVRAWLCLHGKLTPGGSTRPPWPTWPPQGRPPCWSASSPCSPRRRPRS